MRGKQTWFSCVCKLTCLLIWHYLFYLCMGESLVRRLRDRVLELICSVSVLDLPVDNHGTWASLPCVTPSCLICKMGMTIIALL